MTVDKDFVIDKNKDNIRRMFNQISNNYDRLNHLLSLNIDKYWRKKALSLLKKQNIKDTYILDVASGTGDFAFEMLKHSPDYIFGIDLAEDMLKIAVEKAKHKKITNVSFMTGDAENIDIPNKQFDIVTISFGIRNVKRIDKALSEFNRVTKDGGKLLILEFSTPKNIIVKRLYKFYSNTLVPFLGKLISGNAYAYKYLPNSVEDFMTPTELCNKISNVGYTNVISHSLTFGICTVYIAEKK